ncbi:c-type cytochrome [Pontibacter anaerobius]|uniref:Cytochrome c n=1 Tax=Pontibacter anaerobius TaxID=2993940 RepID=A0ABT3RDN4_9BACT|nr:cytochrome c [Pontibacter anaerobius]MCX2739536.1 cytochrome c [Pontibacter anaerobius]
MKKYLNIPKELKTVRMFKPLQLSLIAMLFSTMLFSCSSGDSENTAATEEGEPGLAQQAEAPAEDDGKGVGPVTTVDLGEGINEELAAQGKTIFEGKCSACHQLSDQKVVGPGLAGVTENRKPEWIMNMIINPEEMTKKDPAAKKLLAEHLTQMTNQNVTEQDARAILEFLRQNDQNS